MPNPGPLSTTDPGALTNAHTCAWAATLSYLEEAQLGTEVEGLGVVVVVARLVDSHWVLVLDHGSARIVAFRGTDERADWRTNLNFFGTRTPWGSVHRGFHGAAESLWPWIAEPIRSASRDGRSLWMTGHSLGGALAVLTAARVEREQEGRVAGLFTFGQPAVGGIAFSKKVDNALGDRYSRFVNHTDAVVDVPTLLDAHAGQLRYFDIDGHLHHAVSFRRTLTDHVFAPQRFGGLSQFTAHGMQRYVDLIAAAMSARASLPATGVDAPRSRPTGSEGPAESPAAP